MSTQPTIVLAPREIAAASLATCSDVDLAIRIDYADTPERESPLQRRIEQTIVLPLEAFTVRLGGVEFVFGDGRRLTMISRYGNLAVAPPGCAVVGEPVAQVFLCVPGIDLSAGEVVSFPRPSRVAVDRAHRRVCLMFDGDEGMAGQYRWHALADRLYVALDVAGGLAVILAEEVAFTGAALPVDAAAARGTHGRS